MPIFVFDSLAAVAWILDDERQPPAMAALAGLRADGRARVPALWRFELRDALVTNERRGRLSEAQTVDFPRGLNRLAIAIDRSPKGPPCSPPRAGTG